MAKKVKGFFGRKSHNNTKYPWFQWADGSVWEITKGKDFGVSPHSMRGNLYRAAALRGLKAHVEVRISTGLIRFQFFNPVLKAEAEKKAKSEEARQIRVTLEKVERGSQERETEPGVTGVEYNDTSISGWPGHVT